MQSPPGKAVTYRSVTERIEKEPQVRGGGWRWATAFAGAGGLALGVQVYLLREYLVTMQGDESALGLGLAAWLGGIALGALLSRQLTALQSPRMAGFALAGLALSGWGEVVLARFGRSLTRVPVGELCPLGPSLLLAFMIFAFPGALVGCCFVALAAAARNATGTAAAIGQLYVCEALGSLAAGLLVSLCLLPRLPPLAGLGLVIAISLGAAVPAALAGWISGRRLLPVLSAVALVFSCPGCSRQLESATQQARFATLVTGAPLLDWKDTPYQHVDIGGTDVRVLYAGGQYVTSFPDATESESRAHQLMLLAERPGRVLATGALETGLLRFCLQHPVERLDLVLLDRDEYELTLRHLDPLDRRALYDPRVHVIFEDPRRYFRTEPTEYDLVISLASDPVTLLLARSTTVDYYRSLAVRLAPRGVYVVRFTTGANVQAGQTALLGASLYRSLSEVFAAVRAVPGPDGLLVAAKTPEALSLDPARLAVRYRQRRIRSDVFGPELLPELFPPERMAALEQELGRAASLVRTATDDLPVSMAHALAVRQLTARSAWAPGLAWAGNHPQELALWALCPSVMLLAWQLGSRRREHPLLVSLHATVVTGITGMASSLMLFFSFQTRVGALYSELGAMSALFMLGLAGGGAWSTRRVASGPDLRRAQIIALICTVWLFASFLLMEHGGAPSTMLAGVHALLLVITGIGTGVVFPAAVQMLLASGRSAGAAAGWIELFDHAGAALAALWAAVVGIPALGLTRAAGLLVVLEVMALLANARALEPEMQRRQEESAAAGRGR